MTDELTLSLNRFAKGTDSCAGALSIDGEFQCFTLEDEERDKKVMHETAIPWGRYEIKLRTEGGFHPKYAAKYDFHRGMLWLQDVPGFKWIYIHPGNTDDHTSGCILPGMTCLFNGENHTVGDSVDAYTALYKRILKAMDEGRKVFIEVKG